MKKIFIKKLPPVVFKDMSNDEMFICRSRLMRKKLLRSMAFLIHW